METEARRNQSNEFTEAAGIGTVGTADTEAVNTGAVSYTHLDVYKRQAYIMSYLHDLDDNFKYKSKTYAASLGTTEHPMENTEITLKMEGFDDYKIPLQVFKRYEYLDKLTKVKEEG